MTSTATVDQTHDRVALGDGCVQVDLRYGSLLSTACALPDQILVRSRAAFPGTSFSISGMSGLRFLLERGSATWSDATSRCREGATDAEVEREAVTGSHTLSDPGSWVEEIRWIDGPSKQDVDEVLSGAFALRWCEPLVDDTKADLEQPHPAHWPGRRYTREAFALYALTHTAAGRAVLGELGVGAAQVTDLDARSPHVGDEPDEISFRRAHTWLAAQDLRWLGGHPVRGFLAVLCSLVREYAEGYPEPRDVAEAVRGPLLATALGISAPAAARS